MRLLGAAPPCSHPIPGWQGREFLLFGVWTLGLFVLGFFSVYGFKGKLVCVCRSYWSRPTLLVSMPGF